MLIDLSILGHIMTHVSIPSPVITVRITWDHFMRNFEDCVIWTHYCLVVEHDVSLVVLVLIASLFGYLSAGFQASSIDSTLFSKFPAPVVCVL